MKDEIEQILEDNKCWEEYYGNWEFSSQLAAIELEKYFGRKIIEDLELLKDSVDNGFSTPEYIIEKIDAGIEWYKTEYNL